MQTETDVLIVGAGPTGLACGIEARKAGVRCLIVEKGCLVNSIFSYPAGMTFFTSRERLEIGDLPMPSLNIKPTRSEALEYYRCVTEFYKLPIRYQERVISVRRDDDHFLVNTQNQLNQTSVHKARFVVLATGYYDLPNMMGVPGENLPHVSHYYGEAHQYYQRRVAVVGGANSAAVAALDLFRHGAAVTMLIRERELSRHIKYWIRPDLENRIKEGSIDAYFECEVTAIEAETVDVRFANGQTRQIPADYVFALTGYHPDFEFIRDSGVEIDSVFGRPVCDPETLESNVPGLYLAGVIIAGPNTNEVFIENGRFHGSQIIGDVRRKMAM